MPCRVGITTNPEERKKDWENRVIGFSNWQILGTYFSKEDAQVAENRYAMQYGCTAHAGGLDTPGIWNVYRFDYSREK